MYIAAGSKRLPDSCERRRMPTLAPRGSRPRARSMLIRSAWSWLGGSPATGEPQRAPAKGPALCISITLAPPPCYMSKRPALLWAATCLSRWIPTRRMLPAVAEVPTLRVTSTRSKPNSLHATWSCWANELEFAVKMVFPMDSGNLSFLHPSTRRCPAGPSSRTTWRIVPQHYKEMSSTTCFALTAACFSCTWVRSRYKRTLAKVVAHEQPAMIVPPTLNSALHEPPYCTDL